MSTTYPASADLVITDSTPIEEAAELIARKKWAVEEKPEAQRWHDSRDYPPDHRRYRWAKRFVGPIDVDVTALCESEHREMRAIPFGAPVTLWDQDAGECRVTVHLGRVDRNDGRWIAMYDVERT